jgi:hypothetical protein
LPRLTIPTGPLKVHLYLWRFVKERKNADGDNFIKSFQDTLCEQYGVNDRDIFAWRVEKVIVPKGKEYAAFEIKAV